MTPPGMATAAAVESAPVPITSPSPPPAPRLESTARALLMGCGIGVVLAAGNVYTGLKSTFIDGGNITAALIGFTLFTTFRRLSRTPYSPLENNITQTTAASAAVMGFAAGLSGPVPCLSMMGWSFSGWTIAIWGIATGLIGVLAAALLRQKLVVDDALPFPTGRATAELIETIHNARATAIRRAVLLASAALVAMAVTWFRDGKPRFIPQISVIEGTLAGVAAEAYTLGMSWSPLMMSIGVMVGTRTALSMLLGALTSWAVLAPLLLRHGIVREASFGPFMSWMVWPGVGLLIAGSLLPLLLDAGAMLRSVRDLFSFVGRSGGPRVQGSRRAKLGLGLLVVGTLLVLIVVGRSAFGLSPWVTGAALLLALVLASIAGRSAGETDVGPVGAVGMLTQLTFSGYGALVMLVTGWISLAASSQSSQTLWAFRAGKQLGASPRAQLGAQLLGMVAGAVVVVPVYSVIVRSYGLGTVNMPAPGALSWKATAEAVRGGLSAMPPYAPTAGLIALGVGVVLTLLGKTRFGRYTPSAAAMGIAMLSPASLSFAAAAGALVVLALRRVRPSIDEPSVMAVAAGGIAGESLMGVIIAALIAAGVLAG